MTSPRRIATSSVKVVLCCWIALHISLTCSSPIQKRCSDPVYADPKNVTVKVGDNVTLRCINDVIGADWEQRLNSILVFKFGTTFFFSNFPVSKFEEETGILPLSVGEVITITNISVRHHGQYHCSVPNSCGGNEPSFVTVQGPVEINFYVSGFSYFFPNRTQFSSKYGEGIELLKELPVYRAGQDVKANIIIFGYPEPAMLSIEKRQVDGTYQRINDNRFTLSSTYLMIQPIQLEDNGEYRIWGNNTYGNTPFDFNITVTGVAPPFISLSENQLTTKTYQQSISINCTIQERAFEESLMLYWRYANSTVIPSVGSLRQQRIANDTTAKLIIDSFTEDHNGNYNCFARNSNTEMEANVKIIGPPTQMSIPEVEVISGGPQTVIEWMPPVSFGANITNYSIRRRYLSNDQVYPVKTIQVPSSSQNRYILNDFCPGGLWEFSIAAINEFNNTGEYSEFSSPVNVNGNCPQSSSTILTINSVSTSWPSLTSSSPNNPITSGMEPSVSSPPITTIDPSEAVPFAAIGAAAGVIILIIILGVLIMGISCWVFIAKQSQRRAHTEWRHPGDQTDNDNSLSSQSLPEKSPEPMFNIMSMPTPIPATPGYGPVYIDPCYEFPRENLELIDVLYDGTFTVMYKAKALGIKDNKQIDVAVKSIKDDYLDLDDYVSALVMEMEQLSQLEPHPNIVSLIRVCTVGRPVYMVMEYMCHGDLLGFLRATRGHTDMYTVFPGTKNLPTNLKLTSRDLLNIINQIANGMQFLAEQKIVHGALCARNVLVSTSMEVKVFNIGVHNLDNDESFESLVRWMAPEVFVDGVRTTYSDIWSFGVLMWEIVTVGGTPYSDMALEELYTQLASGMRLNRPAHCTQPIYNIMTSCWESIPQHRLFFIEITEALNNLTMTKTSYLDLRNYNEMQYSQFDITETQQVAVF